MEELLHFEKALYKLEFSFNSLSVALLIHCPDSKVTVFRDNALEKKRVLISQDPKTDTMNSWCLFYWWILMDLSSML